MNHLLRLQHRRQYLVISENTASTVLCGCKVLPSRQPLCRYIPGTLSSCSSPLAQIASESDRSA